jgi:hypothetical protein
VIVRAASFVAGMALAEFSPVSEGFPRCTHCGGVIGVYEPVLRLLEGVFTTTSRAKEPSLSADSPGRVYHALCYELGRRPRAE